MKHSKTAITAMGLAALVVSNCAKNQPSNSVVTTIELSKPRECEKVLDVRLVYLSRGRVYQILCEEKGTSVLYSRLKDKDYWTKIEVK